MNRRNEIPEFPRDLDAQGARRERPHVVEIQTDCPALSFVKIFRTCRTVENPAADRFFCDPFVGHSVERVLRKAYETFRACRSGERDLAPAYLGRREVARSFNGADRTHVFARRHENEHDRIALRPRCRNMTEINSGRTQAARELAHFAPTQLT